MQTLYQIALITHIVGITLMAGTTLIEYLLTKHFWKLFANDGSRAITSNEDKFNFHLLVNIGIIFLILSGVTMLMIFQAVFVKQIWFQIKIGLIIIIAINGSVVGRRQDKELKRLISLEKSNFYRDDLLVQENLKADFMRVKNRLDLFYISQLLMFLTILTLSVFKFN
ncbi:hypothetical protein [Chryseobacterium sp. ISL-6]|uniref:hypothetical protein n=1 Tax=Chryseobacterium sp. ISL-6 TaxID=2819143 RepID=UPI001BEC7C16|nr:hypothetical protein [Chryseobacterium sp. ISL-6]MBT2623639.1 hypothetical protein [Chryseobacterium sp. ISL-6]